MSVSCIIINHFTGQLIAVDAHMCLDLRCRVSDVRAGV